LLKKYYAEEVMGVIYVIDMNDRELLPESIVQLRAELSYVEHNRNPGQVPVLIFANKMDLPNAMAINELKESVEFRSIVKNRAWDVQPSCATSCEGLAEGFDWLAKQIEINRSSLKVTATCHKPNDEQ
jgi:signal recognition particle receptor subunit beta